ncbi:STAS domain-containing protein [Geodermatophilus sp. CPCC 206100]|uniref:STAS domain-containing protein n=1 Tax=Geodermatophilus sp. CPCC 206100 TaxID=3020054 RepID=UPI003AFFBB67
MSARPRVLSSPFPRTLLVSVDLRAGRVYVTGDLDRACAHHLLDALAALSSTAHPVWTVDASGISFCDTEGLRVLARAQALAAARGCSVRVVRARPFLADLVDLAGLATLVDGSAERGPTPPTGWPARD